MSEPTWQEYKIADEIGELSLTTQQSLARAIGLLGVVIDNVRHTLVEDEGDVDYTSIELTYQMAFHWRDHLAGVNHRLTTAVGDVLLMTKKVEELMERLRTEAAGTGEQS